jgi:hypothetical protein
MRLVVTVLLAVSTVALANPAASGASRYVRYGVQDDAWLLYGPGTLAGRVAILKQLGVGTVRLTLRWDQVAALRPSTGSDPDDPTYKWGAYDTTMLALRAARIPVLLTLWGTPRWANRGGGPNVAPVSKWSLAAFARAAATRYPWVRRWTIWNEPNQRLFLRPNSPRLYVTRLLNPTYAALKEMNRRNLIAGGVTSPRRTSSGLSPLAWIRGMRAAHAHLDAYAQHPYPLRPDETPTSGGCWSCAVFTLATLPKLIDEVRRDFGTRTRIWLTEYGYNSKPPSTWLGVPNWLQAQYVSEAALRAYLAPRVDIMIHFLVRDEPDAARWTSGFFTSHGSAKLSARAYALPFAQVSRHGSRTVVWGQVRPRNGRQPYRLQDLRAGRWHWLGATQKTTPRGYVRRTVQAGRGARLRLWSPRDKRYSTTLVVR